MKLAGPLFWFEKIDENLDSESGNASHCGHCQVQAEDEEQKIFVILLRISKECEKNKAPFASRKQVPNHVKTINLNSNRNLLIWKLQMFWKPIKSSGEQYSSERFEFESVRHRELRMRSYAIDPVIIVIISWKCCYLICIQSAAISDRFY